MNIINLKSKYLFINLSYPSSFLIKLEKSGEIWLFNCLEGCQYTLMKKKIKFSQITKIIFTNLTINYISGLSGLLSSLSLYMRDRPINLYGPVGLDTYILLIKKYSQTNFRYKIYVHYQRLGVLESSSSYRLYILSNNCSLSCTNYHLLLPEKLGSFNSKRADAYCLPAGRLYTYLKQNNNFVVPDGCVIYGRNFVSKYHLGFKVIYLSNSLSLML
uniref:Uncharacterized protein n=1 Tax=Neogoniolithon spectabile TaxID=231755 RepID=A0A3G3MH49_9FLOR|nr:hypothetical protein [Neogoniolithon spectabile]AYR06147.1 hypothetical protein [Neogoniolithon spectabile]